jgi:aromatic ring-opening dioxygenase catalytic subunit (LigB family)
MALNIHREEGILVLAGGLTIHNLRNMRLFSEAAAPTNVRDFDKAITVAASQPEVHISCILISFQDR